MSSASFPSAGFKSRLTVSFIFLILFAAFSPLLFHEASAAAVDASGQEIVLEYFFQPGCGTCKQTTPIIDELVEKYNITVVKYNVDRPKNYDLLKEKGYPHVPVVYIGTERFESNKISDGYLENYIIKILRGEIVPDYSTLKNSSGIPEGSADILTLFPFLSVFGSAGTWLNDFVSGSPKIFAYTLGFLAGLSTCLMAMLGFIFVYTAEAEGQASENEKALNAEKSATSKTITGTKNPEKSAHLEDGNKNSNFAGSIRFTDAKESLLRVFVFAAGLILSYLVLGVIFILFEKSLSGTLFSIFGHSVSGTTLVSAVVGILVIVIGLHLLGLFNLPKSWDEKYKTISRKYVASYPGLFVLGILFSFVKVPCTFPFLLVLIDKTVSAGSDVGFSVSASDLGMLLIFCVGVITPLLIVGFVGGYALTQLIRKYKKEIRMVSGIISILLGIWVLFY
ncbi:cytochrome c biogenesis protein CcdA [Methanolapillus ohkumae]|uniref:Cytochrome c biogenesis protein n=1 Tax=Methanolapillus ohkumae TaxID=3028298 RepID=A0AA96V7K6_9EURY|nr:hypothetical protein MsAm2_11020 [Methanosarcinaceae archaeon Am2]